MKGLHKSPIDYLAHSQELIGRPGYVLNIITGCEHTCSWCYARRMVEHGRLKGSKAYPYGFEPTFHPERIRKIGGKPKLIFLNDMGDVGGDWTWHVFPTRLSVTAKRCGLTASPATIAEGMHDFALLNPQHILLLLTKRPEWYGLQEWPDNVWCGFTATNNKELDERWGEMPYNVNTWMSLEPWLDRLSPELRPVQVAKSWVVIGGLTGPQSKSGRAFSDQVTGWLQSYQSCHFVKDNCRLINPTRQYPDEWRIK